MGTSAQKNRGCRSYEDIFRFGTVVAATRSQHLRDYRAQILSILAIANYDANTLPVSSDLADNPKKHAALPFQKVAFDS
jgi:hypothetical protein